ncbi:HlyC/CorC family transporter [Salaquimonas pukyongi]|uniref:HlyC/CorC family transporter n=1 Tax=Salaquimonas pukyongi TaxID=2712698 RepID=UPI00096BA0E0|nr:HlyC/CorC family transporter [Salaquimonas pukyongi]
MTPADWLLLASIVLLILFSAFFSGSETALTAASRARMHTLEKQGDPRAAAIQRLLGKRDRLIGTLLIGNNLVNILASALATSFFLKMFGEAGVFIATACMTVIVVIFAEVMPKSWAIAKADQFSLSVAPFVLFFVLVFAPFARFVTWLVKSILKLFGVRLDDAHDMLSAHDELRGTFEVFHREGAVIKDDRDRLGGVLDLHELEVSDVMVHRTAMMSTDIDQPAEKVIAEILDSPYTRVPLWKDTSDNIVGVLHSKDVLRAIGQGVKPADIDLGKIASTPWFVPETTSLRDQLNAFLRKKAHIAIVVDEYGEVMGLVTLEDILEEIVGDIADEHDVEVSGVTSEPDGSVVVDGGVPIRDLNRALDWELPDDEATTVAGLVIHAAQMIPEEKQAFTFYGKRFVILKRQKNRITRVRIRNLVN